MNNIDNTMDGDQGLLSTPPKGYCKEYKPPPTLSVVFGGQQLLTMSFVAVFP